jgi:hypothetical protein
LAKSKQRVREDLAEMVRNRLVQEVLEGLLESGEFDKAVDAVVAGEKDPYTACDDLLISTLRALKQGQPGW